MNHTELLNRRKEAVCLIDRSIYGFENERDVIKYLLCHESFADDMRRDLESDCALIEKMIGDLRSMRCILYDKVNTYVVPKKPRPRLIRVK